MVAMTREFLLRASRSIMMVGLVCSGSIFLGQSNQSNTGTGAKLKVSENECWPKGGIGIVNPILYIDLKSPNNELVLGSGKRWIGNSLKERQVVFVSGQVVIVGAKVPSGFKMAEASVISFEGDRVVFMDFKAGIGGYYQRNYE